MADYARVGFFIYSLTLVLVKSSWSSLILNRDFRTASLFTEQINLCPKASSWARVLDRKEVTTSCILTYTRCRLLNSFTRLSLHVTPELETFTQNEPFWVELLLHEVLNFTHFQRVNVFWWIHLSSQGWQLLVDCRSLVSQKDLCFPVFRYCIGCQKRAESGIVARPQFRCCIKSSKWWHRSCKRWHWRKVKSYTGPILRWRNKRWIWIQSQSVHFCSVLPLVFLCCHAWSSICSLWTFICSVSLRSLTNSAVSAILRISAMPTYCCVDDLKFASDPLFFSTMATCVLLATPVNFVVFSLLHSKRKHRWVPFV